jgi:choline-sulfatase
MTRLQKHGMLFDNAFTNACMCSPARSTLMSGFFPAQHGVRYTLETDMPAPQYPQVELATSFKNPATVALAAGYTPVYKGKFHCTKPANGMSWVPWDVNQYGFTRWDPPDAGADQSIPEEGGGAYDNDGRFMNSQGTAEAGTEGAVQYLSTTAASSQPFFMVVSLVNPHDVLLYPKSLDPAGYDDSWLEGEIGLPATVHEDLSTKPSVQEEFLRLFNAASGPLPTPQLKRNYLNFYANLMKASDAYLVKILDTLEAAGILDNTLVIATADHGEMGTAHGGLRQKNFNFYEETTRVPLVYSNPRLFPAPHTNHSIVSHVDFLPTLASLLDVAPAARDNWEGIDYADQILSRSPRPGQDYTVFTYDDWQSGQAAGPYPKPPNHIVSIREHRYKLARYYDANGRVPPQWEMYDLKADPLERVNLAHRGYHRTPEQEREYKRLRRKLARVERTRLQPLS